MIESGILREDQLMKSSRLRFEDPFSAQWLGLTALARPG
jgi:hypothetical protein